MEPIYLDELSAAMGSTTFSDLATDYRESSDIKSTIDGFVSGSQGRLQGDSWNAVQAKLSEFSSAMDQRMTLANNLSEAINKALQLLLDYMEDYPYLDYSELPKIEESYRQCEADIASINAALSAKTTVSNIVGYDEDKKPIYGNPPSYEVFVISDQGTRDNLAKRITEIETSMKEIQKLIDKLNGLEAKYNEAKAILDEAFSEVQNFGITVSGIEPSPIVHYVPAS